MVVATVLLAIPGAGFAQQVPSGFTIAPVVGGAFGSALSAFAFLPDGRILVLEKDTGGVRLSAAGSGTSALIATIADVSVAPERGLLGVAVDPEWPQRPYCYFLFTHTSGMLRLVMATASGDLTSPTSTALAFATPYVLLDDLPDSFDNHNGGTLRFGGDGFLYASVGDDSRGCDAQDASILAGKILRLDVSAMPGPGAGPPPKSELVAAGNPFMGSPNARLVYALGFRNPFRFSIDPHTGALCVGDVGLETWEEIDVIEPFQVGGNWGWPELEGPLQDPDPNFADCSLGPFHAAAYVYANPPGGQVASVVGGPLYRVPAGATAPFPRDYGGDVFFCDFYAGWLRRLVRTPTSWVIADPVPGQPNSNDWATNLGNIADLQVGPDGSLYVLVMFSAGRLPQGLHRIVNTLPSDTSADATMHTARVRIVPNPAPSGAGARIEYRAGGHLSPRPTAARVVDVRGRLVSSLSPFAGTGDIWTTRWDGRNAQGRVAAGRYWVEIDIRGGESVRSPIVLVR
jgi:glucose/arabinose dehydrogenase